MKPLHIEASSLTHAHFCKPRRYDQMRCSSAYVSNPPHADYCYPIVRLPTRSFIRKQEPTLFKTPDSGETNPERPGSNPPVQSPRPRMLVPLSLARVANCLLGFDRLSNAE